MDELTGRIGRPVFSLALCPTTSSSPKSCSGMSSSISVPIGLVVEGERVWSGRGDDEFVVSGAAARGGFVVGFVAGASEGAGEEEGAGVADVADTGEGEVAKRGEGEDTEEGVPGLVGAGFEGGVTRVAGVAGVEGVEGVVGVDLVVAEGEAREATGIVEGMASVAGSNGGGDVTPCAARER